MGARIVAQYAKPLPATMACCMSTNSSPATSTSNLPPCSCTLEISGRCFQAPGPCHPHGRFTWSSRSWLQSGQVLTNKTVGKWNSNYAFQINISHFEDSLVGLLLHWWTWELGPWRGSLAMLQAGLSSCIHWHTQQPDGRWPMTLGCSTTWQVLGLGASHVRLHRNIPLAGARSRTGRVPGRELRVLPC